MGNKKCNHVGCTLHLPQSIKNIMQITIDVPNTLPQEFLKQRIQEIEQSFITDARFFTAYNPEPNKETIAAMEDANSGKVERYDSLESMWADLDSD